MRKRQTISKEAFWLLAELARMRANSKGCKGAMLVYCDGLTQMEAANRMDCDQSSIARPCANIKRIRQVVDRLIRELS